jgi:hypothetical protein
MIMNRYEQQLFNELRRTMSRREAEEYLYEAREEQNGDPYEQLRPERYAPGVKQEMKREKIKAAVDRRAKGKAVDPEHPVLRKYIPAEWGTDVSGLTKAAHQAMKADIATTYDIPVWILYISILETQETKIPEFKERISKPNRRAYELLSRKKTRLSGLFELLGKEIYELFLEPYKLVSYAKECQENVL